LLLHHLRRAGCRALAMKPFCSGGREDVKLLQSFQRGELSDAEVNPFYFRAPIAPLVELRKAGKNIPLRKVVAHIKRIEGKCERLLVEGSGGLMAPLGRGYFVADLIAELDCRVIVAARNRLGTINHTLLTVERLRAAGTDKQNIVAALMCGPGRDVSSATNESVLKELLWPIEVVSIPSLGRRGKGADLVKRGYLRTQEILQRLI
jgi:dethiobiotin synthetase